MPAGRPSKYTPELLQTAQNYMLGEWKEVHQHAIPSVQGLCVVLNIAESTAYAWAEDENKEFSGILVKIKTNQHHALIDGGLKGDLNSNITKLALGKHNYHDKTDNTLTGKDGGNVGVDVKWSVEVVEPDSD